MARKQAKAEMAIFIKEVREAVANYIASEGCTWCKNVEAHKENTAKLARLLNVPEYKDHSGYDFSPFRTPRQR